MSEYDIIGSRPAPAPIGGLFAGVERTREAIETASARVSDEVGGDDLIQRTTDRLLARCARAGADHFTADNVAVLLDEQGVARDQDTRRRVVSTIIERGRKRLWTPDGYTASQDARRQGRPVTRWRLTPDGIHRGLEAAA